MGHRGTEPFGVNVFFTREGLQWGVIGTHFFAFEVGQIVLFVSKR